MAESRTILRNLTIITMNDRRDIDFGDIAIEEGRILAAGVPIQHRASDRVIDCAGQVAIPGLVQAHIHLTQTLFRNHADDLELMDWLRHYIWPFEAKHTPDSNYAAARLGIAELLHGGTTAILDMGTVDHHDEVFRAALEMGIRYTGGKAMMDVGGEGVPPRLKETTQRSIDDADGLSHRWHGKGAGRLRYAWCPRFVVTCTDDLLRVAATRARELGTPVHIHASENKGEIELVRQRTGKGNLEWLSELGVLAAPAAVAHCVHLDDGDEARLVKAKASAVHCPGSNLKLASGLAPIPRMLAAGVNVALGADGAPCNNNLDAFLEMRLAALLQKPVHGPKAMPAADVLWMATRGGAQALGLAAEIGSLEAGKRADVVVLDLMFPHSAPWKDPVAATVYSARPDNVRHVLVGGAFLKRDFRMTAIDRPAIAAAASEALRKIAP